jgi:hypothetical protein
MLKFISERHFIPQPAHPQKSTCDQSLLIRAPEAAAVFMLFLNWQVKQ